MCVRACCNNCAYVCDSVVMCCVTVRGLCLCVLSLCVRVLNMCVLCVFYCVVLCMVSVCPLCLGAWFNVSVCFVCGELCDVVWFAFGACCFVFVCFLSICKFCV